MTAEMTETWLYPLEWGQTLDFAWFPFRIDRFLTSRFLALSVARGQRDAIGTAVVLWAESFRQDPAGTLPDDDTELASLARFGADFDAWRAVRETVLYGWRPVDVGGERFGPAGPRLGHPVIAAEATEMWRRKDNSGERAEARRISNMRHRVKVQLRHIGARAAMYNDADYVAKLAGWLANAGLQITRDNVVQGVERLADAPAEIAAHPQWKKGSRDR